MLLYKSQEAVIKLFSDYSSIVFEAKYKSIYEKDISRMSARVARGRVAKVYDRKVLINITNSTCISRSR